MYLMPPLLLQFRRNREQRFFRSHTPQRLRGQKRHTQNIHQRVRQGHGFVV
jgi:hypothetical protein